MNYRHAYHAGHATDVFKHVVLCYVLQHMRQKGKPFRYLETHAGMASYDLMAPPSQKTQEYQTGIAKLWAERSKAWDLGTSEYLSIVEQAQSSSGLLDRYPGSSQIAQHFLSSTDHMIVNDSMLDVYENLYKSFARDKRVHCHRQDAYTVLNAMIPFPEKRGVILIDPAYEAVDEWDQLIYHLSQAYQKWPQGIYLAWYPIKETGRIASFHQKLSRSIPSFLVTEMNFQSADVSTRLNGSGLVMINPPFQLDRTLKTALPALLDVLQSDNRGETRTFFFHPTGNK